MKPKITILMSTYNGEQYIEKQLQSLYDQSVREDYQLELIIRDDGSKDETSKILNRWKDRLQVTVLEGENKGARDSFFELFFNAPDSDYYAFCDQDDIWDRDKLEKAICYLKNHENSLYFSNLEYMDDQENDLGTTLLSDAFSLSLKRIFMCNPANGCVMVWDRNLQKRMVELNSEYYTMHDEFVCTTAFVLGHVYYDPEPSMKYRIHALNVTQSGSFSKKIKLWKEIWFGRKAYPLDKRAAELLPIAREEDRSLLQMIADYKKGLNRFRFVKLFKCEDAGIQRSFVLRMLLGLL